MKNQKKSRNGFSLVEVVIAIGIVAVLLTTFMAVFGPAQKNINRALGVADANRLVTTLENEMATYRSQDINICKFTFDDQNGQKVSNSFEKAFQWVKGSATDQSAIVIYQYQAYPEQLNDDGTLKAIDSSAASSSSLLPGVDYITQTVARRLDNAATLEQELQPGVVSGNVYVVRMTQLVTDGNKGLVLGVDHSSGGTENEIFSPAVKDGSSVDDSSNYEDAYIAVQVEFFQLNNNLYEYVTGGKWSFGKLGAPVATQNIAVRR